VDLGAEAPSLFGTITAWLKAIPSRGAVLLLSGFRTQMSVTHVHQVWSDFGLGGLGRYPFALRDSVHLVWTRQVRGPKGIRETCATRACHDFDRKIGSLVRSSGRWASLHEGFCSPSP